MEQVKRNAPCPCGSGKKYKQCCLKRDQQLAASTRVETISIPKAILEASKHHQAGRLSQAEALYRQILQIDPAQPDALNLLGLIAQHTGQHNVAVELIGKAIKTDSLNPSYYNNLGISLQEQGNFVEAAERYREALSLKPDYADAHSNLGTLLQEQGKLDEAVNSYLRAISCQPNCVSAYFCLSNLFREQNKLSEAIEFYHKVLLLKPDYAEAHMNLGITFQEQDKLDEASNCYRQAILFKPDYALAQYNLGKLLHKQGKLNEALTCYQAALLYQPDQIEVYCSLGDLLKEQDELDKAINCYREALLLKPDYPVAHNQLGLALQKQGKLSEAVKQFQQALLLTPDFAQAHSNLGMVLVEQGRLSEASEQYRIVLSIEPDFCVAHSNLIFTLDVSAKADMAELFGERRKWDAAHAAPLWQEPNHANDPSPTRRLRIGYVSADFREHSAPRVFGGMLTRYDRAQFEVFAYSNYSGKDDLYTGLFKQNVTAWRDIADESDETVDKMIREDRIDILVDLSGHSGGNRLLVFARKPAPIQITAWGYATGTGMRAMDVFFTDPVMVPPQDQQYFSEQVRYLPSAVGSFGVEPYPDVNELPALRDGVVTFGSFNRLAKVSADVYRTWAEILLAVPTSQLILKASELSDPAVREQVMGHFLQAGVAANRVIMLERTSWYEHMRAYNRVDLALDPFPHGGGVTAIEGLIMGVPVLSLRWPTVAGRLSASIMTTLGQPDWIAESREEYVKLAEQKASDLPSLAGLRQCLRIFFMASVIGDQTAYARAVEHEYRLLWQEWCARRRLK